MYAQCAYTSWTLSAHQSAVLHVFLQPLHGLPAHTFTFWTGDSAFGHNLQLPALLLTSWWTGTDDGRSTGFLTDTWTAGVGQPVSPGGYEGGSFLVEGMGGFWSSLAWAAEASPTLAPSEPGICTFICLYLSFSYILQQENVWLSNKLVCVLPEI